MQLIAYAKGLIFIERRSSGLDRTIKRLLIMSFNITVLLLTAACLHVCATGFPQAISLSEKNAPLTKVMEDIEKQCGLSFVYGNALVRQAHPITIDVKGELLSNVLERIFRDQPLGYAISGDYIVLKPKQGQLLQGRDTVSDALAPPVRVSGHVADAMGNPLVGATVSVKGRSKSAVTTDEKGDFIVEAPDGDAIIEISFIGYETQQLPAPRKGTLTVILKAKENKLDDIVVIGYGSVKAGDLTGAVTSLKKVDLPQGTDASIGQMLSGKAPGVTVTNTNALPGGGVQILIRGATSTGAGNDPLFVVDGFPITNSVLEPGNGTSSYYQGDRSPLNSLNPDDIESIEILKDASASAIYGARAANGVILITTKRGKKGINVSYNAQYSTQTIRKPFEMLSARQYMDETNKMIRERWLRNNAIAPYGAADSSSVAPWIPRYSPADIASVGNGTDWWRLTVRPGAIQEHNVSLSGGSDNVKAYVSLGYFGQDGVERGSNFKRLSGKINLDYKISSKVSTGISLLASNINNRNLQAGTGQWEASGVIMSSLMFDPTLPVKDAQGNYSISNYYANMPNPVSFQTVDDRTNQSRILTNLFAEITPVNNLKIRASVGYDGQSAVRKSYYPKTFLYGQLKGGQAAINNIEEKDYLFDVTANYSYRRGDHSASLLGGYAYQQFNNGSFGVTATGFFTDVFSYNDLGAADNRAAIGSSQSRSVLGSYFGRFNYSYKDRYLLTANARYDGSDKFGVNNKWGFFPSVALAWKLSEEPFMKNLTSISNLKLRASYGRTGNSNIGSNAFAFYAVNRSYVFNDQLVVGVSPSQLANPDLKWETTTSANIGIDFGFFNNRISGTVDVYEKSVSDLLGYQNLRSWMLLPNVAANLGETQSRGLEVGLTTVNIDDQRSGLTWSTTVTYTSYKDRWKKRSKDVVLNPWEKVNDPIRPVFTYKTGGILQPGQHVAAMPAALPGNLIIKDINGVDQQGKLTGKPDGQITEADQVLIGTVDPKFTLGVNNTVRYKKFDLSIFCYGMFGRLTYNQADLKYIGYSSHLVDDGTNLRVAALDRWSSTHMNGKYPSDANNSYLGNDAWVWQNNSFLRVKNITVGYDLSSPAVKKVFSVSRVYASVQNPFVFTRWDGMDPETDNGNMAPYPNTVSVSFGLNVSL